MEKTVEITEDTIYVTINEKTFYIYTKENVKDLLKDSWMQKEKDKFVPLTDDLYLYDNFNRGQMYDAIDIGTFDWAYPESWADQNRDMIKSRGGVVWSYGPATRYGAPYYDDMARERLKGMILQAIKDNS